MRKQCRDRKQQKNDSEMHYGGVEESKPDEKARERFKKPAYEVTDVIGYTAKKYDIKGEMQVGQEKTEAVPTTAKGDTAS